MASFLTTLKFLTTYLWVVAKYTLILISTSWILYLIKFTGGLYYFISTNLFAVNFVLIYFLFKRDKYLELNKFYLFFNITDISIFISKSILLGIPFMIHFSLFLIVTIGITIHLYITLLSIVILILINRLIFFNIRCKWFSGIYLIILMGLFLLSYFISGVSTMIILSGFSILCLLLVVNISIPLI